MNRHTRVIGLKPHYYDAQPRIKNQVYFAREPDVPFLKIMGFAKEAPLEVRGNDETNVETASEPFDVKPKRTYTRRDMTAEKPKRTYKRRDMAPEE